MACFVTGSPMIEQLQPRGGTEKVFRITVGIMGACYRPSPSGRKHRPLFWFSLSLNGPSDFRIEQRPASSLTAKPHEESRSGAVGAEGFDIYNVTFPNGHDAAKAARFTDTSDDGNVKVKFVRPFCMYACTITSTTIPAAASGLKTAA